MLVRLFIHILLINASNTLIWVPPYYLKTMTGITAYEKLLPVNWEIAYPNITTAGINSLTRCFEYSVTQAPWLFGSEIPYPWTNPIDPNAVEPLPDEVSQDGMQQGPLTFSRNGPNPQLQITKKINIFPSRTQFIGGSCVIIHTEYTELIRVMEYLLHMCKSGTLDITLVDPKTLSLQLRTFNKTINSKGYKTVISERLINRYYNEKLTKCSFGPKSVLIQLTVPVISTGIANIHVKKLLPVPFAWEDQICMVDKHSMTFAVLSFLDNRKKRYMFTDCNPQINRLCPYSESTEDLTISTKCATRVVTGGRISDFRQDCPLVCHSDSFPRLLRLGEGEAIYSHLHPDQKLWCPDGEVKMSHAALVYGGVHASIPCRCHLVNITTSPEYPCHPDSPVRAQLLTILPIQWARLSSSLSLPAYETFENFPKFDSQEDSIDFDWNKNNNEKESNSNIILYCILGVLVLLNLCILGAKLYDCVLTSHICPCTRATARGPRFATAAPSTLAVPRTPAPQRPILRRPDDPIPDLPEYQDIGPSPAEIRLQNLRPSALPVGRNGRRGRH